MNQSASRAGGRLQDKVILVTGSTTGIGEAAARLFAREGAFIMIHGRRKDAAEALAAELGERAAFTIGALEDPAVPARLVEDTVARFGRIDGIVNNAAVMPMVFCQLPCLMLMYRILSLSICLHSVQMVK